MPTVQSITSRDNPLIQRLRRLAQEPVAYRKQGEVWLEGDHLCSACLSRQVPVPVAVVADSAWIGEHGSASGEDARAALASRLARAADKVVVVPEALWHAFTGLESPARIGFLLPLEGLKRQGGGAPDAGGLPGILPQARSVVLDRLQDAGNVGSILRSAAALGAQQVLALKGTAGLWSPKVLRAGMGAHFALHLVEQLDAADLSALQVPLVATSSHTEHVVSNVALPEPCAWVMGHEGQGVSEALQARCTLTVTIPQPGGEESLNVAAATAICLYESLRQRS
ncbi:MAG: RNA methyltransferase [Proteobacteria bacterium]|uniref:TrmH family RNA methyltransferase n=1 Tax=Aquabacterium sp. TaxID=1872578 RepID=UPI0035C67898|nr:RNA methyltransferase [Pseudomonadota bacterium]